jgi:hypothetical protein
VPGRLRKRANKGKEPAHRGSWTGNEKFGAERIHPDYMMPPQQQHGEKPDAPIPVMGRGDLEAGGERTLRHAASKVSLPLASVEGGIGEASHSSQDAESIIQWGPMHPCYPHLNPHVPTSSSLFSSTRIIRVPRDWMIAGDLAPTFANVYPEVLDGLVSEDEFRRVLRHVNDQVMAAFNPFGIRSWIDILFGIATFWLWDDLGFTGVKKRLKDLESWLEKWNEEVGSKEGVTIIPLRRAAYMSVCISLLPHSNLRFTAD